MNNQKMIDAANDVVETLHKHDLSSGEVVDILEAIIMKIYAAIDAMEVTENE